MNTPKSFLRISVIFIGLLLSSFVCCASAQDNDILTPVEYKRPPDQTYLTFPEWYIVYSSEEYANTLKHYKPSEFPYLGASKQFWNGYSEVKDLTKAYPYNSDYHTMIKVIGTSMSLEYLLKGLYENSIGRFTEWTRTHGPTSEDKFAYQVAEDYVSFIKI